MLEMAEVGSLWRTRDGKCIVLTEITPDDLTWGYRVDRGDWPDFEVTTSSYGVNARGIQSSCGEETKWDLVEPWDGAPVPERVANIHRRVLAGEYSRY